MAIKAKELIPAKYAENSQTTQFIAEAPTAIDKFTITNTSANVVKFSANLVVASATAGASNLIIKEKTVAAGDTYTCPELVGHNLAVGSSISTLVDTSSALVIRASGREIT
ncbi:hypothetical protein [Acinetobacter baumannii]|uniref:hypothetical protein n=1 Tax=Acinetobacter baumannii TaxID=470 RepID=UPI0019008F61|nr:hypothetical protein [Acinetobacter baumannii]MBJ9481160.1 hypothetical protein [Acinetobacter baumannii]MBJ9910036.1 hypothetical protein [Acinetobacter baumannii]MBJ9944523.1 hypothetical protein [Acinetobacter baumannii]